MKKREEFDLIYRLDGEMTYVLKERYLDTEENRKKADTLKEELLKNPDVAWAGLVTAAHSQPYRKDHLYHEYKRKKST